LPEAPWQRIADVFDAVVDLPAEARADALAQLCGDDRSLLDEVTELLAADEGAPGLLETPAALAAPTAPPQQIGPWTVLDLLGEGGMGSVYRVVRRDGSFEQTAALKLLRPELAGPGFAARFHSERRILASLTDPAIARLIDGGSDAAGTPYLVLELVEGGAPIDRYCDERALPVEARIDLVLQVCDAVASAHARLVVHRDLKPANILVGRDGRPKLLDFGVAKVLDPSRTGLATLETRAGPAPLTLACAAPEQLRGTPVTTACDVYGLGVLLYGLLSGQPPHDLRGLGLAEITARICDRAPPPPSSVTVDPGRGRRLRGDLDAIVLKALRKDPADRYPSVDALADDLRRHLEGRPVHARTGNRRYRLRKFVQRNRAGVIAGTVAVLVLLLGAGSTAWQARRALIERDRAVLQERRAQRTAALIEALFAQADPALSPGGEGLSARALVDRGERQVIDGLAEEPEVQADLLDVLGRVQASLGAWGRAVTLHQRALTLRQSLATDPTKPDAATARTLFDLGQAARLGWQPTLAEDSLQAALDQRRLVFGPDDPLTLEAEAALALALSDERGGRTQATPARASFQHVLAASDDPDLRATCWFGLASLDRSEGHPERAVDSFQKAADAWEGLAQPLRQAEALEGVSVSLSEAGHHDDRQQAVTEQALAIKEGVLGPDHPLLVDSIINLGAAAHYRGEYGTAVEHYERALAITRANNPDPAPTAIILSNIGVARLYAGQLDLARAALEQAYAIRIEADGPDAWSTAGVSRNLAHVLLRQGEAVAAERLIRQALAAAPAEQRPHPVVGNDLALQGAILLAEGRDDDAEDALTQALTELDDAGAGDTVAAAAPLLTLSELRLRQGRADDARELAVRGLRLRQAAFGETHWMTWEARSVLGAALVADGDGQAGGALLRDSLATLQARLGGAHFAVVAARRRLDGPGSG